MRHFDNNYNNDKGCDNVNLSILIYFLQNREDCKLKAYVGNDIVENDTVIVNKAIEIEDIEYKDNKFIIPIPDGLEISEFIITVSIERRERVMVIKEFNKTKFSGANSIEYGFDMEDPKTECFIGGFKN